MKVDYHKLPRVLKHVSWLVPFLLVGIIGVANATTLTIENGTAVTSNQGASPVNDYYESYRMQMVYTADELYENGWTAGQPGTISQLGFYNYEAPTNAKPNWTIKLKNTSAVDASSHDGSGLTTVYTNSSYSPTAGSYEMHSFTTNFDWDGVSNLLVDICWDVASGWSSTGKVRAYNYTNGMRYVRSTSTSKCGESTTTQLGYKPSMQLVINTNTNAPSNDAICSASALTVDADPTTSTNLYSTTVSGDAIGSCWSVSSKSHTVWYSFTAPSDGKADIYVEAYGYQTLTNTQVAIFSSSDGSCSGTLTEVGCDDNSGTPGCSNCAYEQLTGLTATDTYFIEVDGSSSDTGSFSVSVRSAAITWDNDDGDNDWTTANNWSNNTVPTSVTNVYLDSGTPFIPTKTTAACNNLTIKSGITLRIETGTKDNQATAFNVYGDVINDGTIEHNGNYYMNLYGNDQRLGGSGSFTTTSGVGPGYSFQSGSKITLTSNVSSFQYISIDGVVELGSKTLQTNNFTIASGATLKQNTGTLEIQETTPDFTGYFLPQQGTTYYNVTGSSYDVDDVSEYYNLKVKANNGYYARMGGTSGFTCNNMEIVASSASSSKAVVNETLTLNGNLTIGSNCFIDLNDGTPRTMKVAGNITNNGTGFETPANGTLELNGSTTQTISGTAITVNDFTINNADATGINLSTAITLDATGILTLTDGVINTSSTNILTLGTGATVSGVDGSAASHISGPMDKNTNTDVLFKFPLGEEGVYKPVGITPSVADPHTFRAQAWNDSPNDGGYNPSTIASGQLNNVSTLEYWDVDRTSGTDLATIRLYWDSNSQVDDETSADLRVAHWNTTNSNWEDLGQTIIDTTNNWIEVEDINSFSPFTLGSDGSTNNPLPVELVSFDAKPKGMAVELTWETISEINNDYFEIERSVDGKDFESIIEIEGAGNSTSSINYSVMDENPITGMNYYRLKQTDFDGEFEYSDIVNVKMAFTKQFELIGISPMPSTSVSYLTLNATETGNVFLNIYDNKGDLIKKDRVEVLEGLNEITLDMSNLQSGVYFITVQGRAAFVSSRIIKTKNMIY
ncbi:T9SS type A sorting domain-containing protein [Cytophagaceae bacterium AH-315-L13]|nr:T9SS type A sorting domain-containing protein [Cytophagaceae bacterium AH-315-L13]